MNKYPKEIIVVTTDFVYKFGKPNERGIRSIERDDGMFDFGTCRIVHLEVGRMMTLDTLDSAKAYWHTDNVLHIIELGD
jgi:hypothetical protein